MNNDEFDIVQALKISWKKRNVLLIIMAISIVIGAIYTFILTRPMYQSNTKILIDKSAASIVTFVQSNDIATEVAGNLSLSASYIIENASVAFDKNTQIISISATSKDNEEAYAIVNKYEEVLKAKLENVYGVKSYTTIEQAQVSNSAYNVNYVKDILMFVIGGIVVCGVYCIFLVTFSGANIYAAIANNKITLLGKINKEIKSKSKVKSYISKNERITAQIKKIMTNIELNKRVSRPKSILVTATNYGIGNTYVVSNLAMRYSKAGKRVLIIDSNFEDGIENKIFNIDSQRGLSDLIMLNQISTDNLQQTIKQSPISNIFVLPCGEEVIDEELLISEKINKIIELTREQFDIIIVDGEPILKQITSYGWASSVNATVVVGEYAKTRIDEIVKAKRTIEDVGGKISGVIVNKAE